MGRRCTQIGFTTMIEHVSNSSAQAALEFGRDTESPSSVLESLLFVASEPVDVATLSQALNQSSKETRKVLSLLADELESTGRGIRLQEGPEGITLVSAPEYASAVENFMGIASNRKLSRSALETLSIIAYRQPTTRGQIEHIRGVGADSAIATLRLRGLIEPAGRASGPGRPLLFRTTQKFLSHFGLSKASDMPALPDHIEIPITEIAEQLGMDEAIIASTMNANETDTEIDRSNLGEAAGAA